MKFRALAVAMVVATFLGGCVTTETASFEPSAGQQSVIRDGRPAIISQRTATTVVVAPASRAFRIGARPVYVVGIANHSQQPITFRLADIRVQQIGGSAPSHLLKVYSYDELVSEEHRRQIGMAILGAVVAGANSYAAARSGGGPLTRAVNEDIAANQNAEMMNNISTNGQMNLAMLEQAYLKDDTIMPGEWYGGQLQFDAPSVADPTKPKEFVITVPLGPDLHQITVVQTPIGQ